MAGLEAVEVTVVVRGSHYNVSPTEKRPDLASLGLPPVSGAMRDLPDNFGPHTTCYR